jgi:cell division protein FtsB
VALRLWRLTKLSEEIVAVAAERIDYVEQRNQELNNEIKELRVRLGLV